MNRSGWRQSSLGCLVSGLAFHFGLLTVLLAIWVAVGLPVGSHLLRQSERAWSREFLSEEEFSARHPVREHSPSALQLDALARQIGTSLAVTPGDLKDSAPPAADELKEIWPFLGTLRKSQEDGFVRVPAALARATESRARQLGAMEDVLLAGDVVWETPRSREEMSVSWVGLRNVQSLLLVRSLLADQRGALSARDRTLEASWRLNQDLWRRTDPVEMLLAIGHATDRNACLRRYRSVEDVWGERLSGARALATLVDIHQADGQGYCQGARRLAGIRDIDFLMSTKPMPTVGPLGWLFRVATAPYLRVSVAGYSDALRLEVRELQATDLCSLEQEPYVEWLKSSQPAWNVFSRVALPSLVGSWLSARDAGLDAELTAAVLKARQRRDHRGELQEESAVCPQVVWVTHPIARGKVLIEAQGGVPADDSDARSPLAYTLTRF